MFLRVILLWTAADLKLIGLQEANAPVRVQTGDGGFPVAVQVLRLLQENVVEHPGDVDGDVVLYGLYHCISAASCSSLLKATNCKSHQHNYLIISALSVYFTISKFSYLRAKTCKSKHTEKKKV